MKQPAVSVSGPMTETALADWLAYLESIGAKPCICRYEWRSHGRLYGQSMGMGWIRMNTHQECQEHGQNRSQAIM